MIRVFLAAVLLGCSITASAGDITDATVKSIMIDKSYGLKAYIELNQDLVTRANAPCHNSVKWEYVVDLSTPFGETLYASLLVAYTSQNPANFFGTGDCLHSGIEELRRVEFRN